MRQQAYGRHQKVASLVWHPNMPFREVQSMGNPYLNTYDSGCPLHPYLSRETKENIPQLPQANESNLERAMAELTNSRAKMENYQVQMATSYREEAMNEIVLS